MILSQIFHTALICVIENNEQKLTINVKVIFHRLQLLTYYQFLTKYVVIKELFSKFRTCHISRVLTIKKKKYNSSKKKKKKNIYIYIVFIFEII